MEQLQQEIRNFVVTNFLFGEDNKLGNDDSFIDTGIIDSTGILELVSFLEEKYSISMDDHELVPDNLDSVNRLVTFLGRKLRPSN